MGAESPAADPGPGGPAPEVQPAGRQPVALDLRDHVLFDPRAPRAQPITSGGDLSLQLICLEPRQTLPPATLDADRLYTVIGGRAWAVVDDAEIHLDPLQAVLVPAGAAHGLRNDSADPLILQVVDGSTGPAAGGGATAASYTGTTADPPPDAAPSTPEPSTPAPPTPAPASPERDRFARIRKLLGSRD